MLLDHFHPPLNERRHWTGFHSHWAGCLATDLNQRLPAGWFAEPQVRWGIEVDVATYDEAGAVVGQVASSGESPAWEPPEPAKTIAFPLQTDIVEVQVFRDLGEAPLAGVIEILSPANKDRFESREAFASKCETFLRDAIGLVMVDIVTERSANLHAILMERFGQPGEPDNAIYSAAYHPLQRGEQQELDIWYEPLEIGGPIPSLPLYLKNGPCIRVNFEETYCRTCRDLRIPDLSGN